MTKEQIIKEVLEEEAKNYPDYVKDFREALEPLLKKALQKQENEFIKNPPKKIKESIYKKLDLDLMNTAKNNFKAGQKSKEDEILKEIDNWFNRRLSKKDVLFSETLDKLKQKIKQ